MLSRRSSWLLLSILSCLCLGFGPPALVASDLDSRGLAPHQLRAMHPVPQPKLTAVSVLLLNPTTGQILLAQREHERRAPASLVKMMTAMVALQHGRLDQDIRVRLTDVQDTYSAVGIIDGDLYTLQDLLYLLLLPSDNAAALTVARGVGGKVPTFVAWMNDQAKAWGLNDTHFTNPHGLDEEGTYSTAYDMAVIALQAMANPTFASIVRQPKALAAQRNLEATNQLLALYPGTVGVKTGTTDRAGECLVALVDRPQGKALGIVMGSTDRYADMRLLMDYFYANFAELHLDLGQTEQNRYLDAAGTWHAIRLREPMTLIIAPWQLGGVSLYRRLDNPSATPDPNQPVGALEVTWSGKKLVEVPLYAR
jgi:D-alanyl-D-alanine carboxypeptidase